MVIDSFPPHHLLYITHNGHRSNYESINDYLNEDYIKNNISYEEAQKCLESDSIWEIQLYPITPISFFKTIASTYEKAIDLMLENFRATE
jgi:hypothetical protein